MKLIIADDHPIVLDGLEALLRGSEYEVIARCGNGQEVLALLESTRPDVLLLDVNMHPVSGLEVLQLLRQQARRPKVIILTASMEQKCLFEAVRLGADAILLKKTASRRLLECLEAVGRGEGWLDPEATQRLVQAAVSGGAGEGGAIALTARELDITRLVAAGLRNKQIAYEMSIAEPTVKMHLHNIYEKLGVGSRTELALLAHSRGIL